MLPPDDGELCWLGAGMSGRRRRRKRKGQNNELALLVLVLALKSQLLCCTFGAAILPGACHVPDPLSPRLLVWEPPDGGAPCTCVKMRGSRAGWLGLLAGHHNGRRWQCSLVP